MQNPADADALWLGMVGILVLLTWLYDFYRAAKSFRQGRTPLARFTNARALFRSSGIVIGLVRIVLGSFVRAYPGIPWLVTLQDFIAPVLTIFLLTGGVVMIVLWKAEDSARSSLREGPKTDTS